MSMFYNARLIWFAISLGGAGAYLASGSAQASQDFDVPAKTVLQRLGTSSHLVEGSGMGSLTVSGAGSFAADQVKIRIVRAGEPKAVYCLVQVEELSPGSSRANLDCSQPRAEQTPMLHLGEEAIAIVAEEHVAAAALARPYDVDGVSSKMIALAARSAPALVATLEPPDESKSERPSPRAPEGYYDSSDEPMDPSPVEE